MDKLNCNAIIYILLCDNDKAFLEQFKELIISLYKQKGIAVNVGCVTSADELFLELETNGRPDVLFIDIELETDCGIDIVSKIRETDRYLDIVFVSAYDRYCYDSFKQRPIGFLRKPVVEAECQKLLDEIYRDRYMENRMFAIKTGNRIVNEKYSDIIYIESDRRYVTFFCADGREHKMKEKLNNIEKQLKTADVIFLRIHQSFLVNLKHVHIFDYDKVIMSNDKELPIAYERRKNIRNTYFDICLRGENDDTNDNQ